MYPLASSTWEARANSSSWKDVSADQVLEEGGPNSYMYRMMNFSLAFDKNEDLKTQSRRVQSFKVPKNTSADFLSCGPVAFFL